MKTASIPSLRVAPQLRKAAERVLREGETLSGFLEESLRAQVHRRQMQQEFIARGLAAREDLRRTGKYFTAAQVLGELQSMLVTKKSKSGR